MRFILVLLSVLFPLPATAMDVQEVKSPSGLVAWFVRDTTIPVVVDGPGTLGLRWLLIDPASGMSVAEGDAAPGATAGTFDVTIGADVAATLFPGPYQLYLAASSDALALVTERKVDVEVGP